MILKVQDKVLVAHRRLFEGDHARFFVGSVDAYDAGLARVTGRTFVRDGYRGEYTGRSDERTKIVAIASGTVIVYQLPERVDLGTVEVVSEGTGAILVDAHGFRMDLSESAHDVERRRSA